MIILSVFEGFLSAHVLRAETRSFDREGHEVRQLKMRLESITIYLRRLVNKNGGDEIKMYTCIRAGT